MEQDLISYQVESKEPFVLKECVQGEGKHGTEIGRKYQNKDRLTKVRFQVACAVEYS